MNEQEKKVEQVVEKIPEDTLKIMQQLVTDRNKLLHQYLNISMEFERMKRIIAKIYDDISSKTEKYNQKIRYAYGKELKLKKKKNYHWKFNGVDSFIGIPIPEKKQEDKK